MHSINAGFVMFEDGCRYDGKRLRDLSATIEKTSYAGVIIDQHNGFIELNYPTLDKRLSAVSTLLACIEIAYQQNFILVLNREGAAVNVASLPHDSSKPRLASSRKVLIGMFTSGTTGKPKLIFQAFSLINAQTHCQASLDSDANIESIKQYDSKWLLCYHPFSYAGLQVIWQAILHSETLYAASDSTVAKLAELAIQSELNCISATPSFFRALLMSWGKQYPPLSSITLGGETCEQSLLRQIETHFPKASCRHIYATTESGVVFTVKDGLAGFPVEWLEHVHNGWKLRIEDGALVLSQTGLTIHTGDRVEQHNTRILFTGRSDNLVNVGGVKVDLDALEAKLIKIDGICDARVYAKANPITGYIIGADIQKNTGDDVRVEAAFKDFKSTLVPAAQPRIVKWVDNIALGTSGKKQRILK